MTVTVAIGTVKGAWFATSDDRREWELSGPVLKGWEVTTFGSDLAGADLAAAGSSWYGAAIHRSGDRETWEQIVDGPAYPEEMGRSLSKVWTIERAGDALLAGVADAGLFRSDDGGDSWQRVEGLDAHPSRAAWQPGAGGLGCHRVLVDPADPGRWWLGISAVGVLYTEDGGESFELRNKGVTSVAPHDDHDIGYCVHGLAADPSDPETIWRQDHSGVYRTTDGAMSWERIENGLPARFGFPIVRDPVTGRLAVVPLESDEYRMPVDGTLAVYHSDDGGDSWQAGRRVDGPDRTYHGVLRGALAVDGLEPGGMYVGSTGGEVLWSSDVGETWSTMPWTFPRVLSVRAHTG